MCFLEGLCQVKSFYRCVKDLESPSCDPTFGEAVNYLCVIND